MHTGMSQKNFEQEMIFLIESDGYTFHKLQKVLGGSTVVLQRDYWFQRRAVVTPEWMTTADYNRLTTTGVILRYFE